MEGNEVKDSYEFIQFRVGFSRNLIFLRFLIDRDTRNEKVLFPYLNGKDLNSRPDQSASRWVINFRNWPLERGARGSWTKAGEKKRRTWLRSGIVPEDYPDPVAADYPDCLDIVRTKVKPERDKNRRKVRRERWWQFAERALELYATIEGMERVLVLSLVNNHLGFVMKETSIVFAHKLAVFPLSDFYSFTSLQSHFQYHWAWYHSSTMRNDINYSPSDCLETFPFPIHQGNWDRCGAVFYAYRQELMGSRKQGITKTYNRFHNSDERSSDIAKLRELHIAMDRAVAEAYCWSNLVNELDHDFHKTRQGIRFTISEKARRDVLDRLLQLNHERYREEVEQGLHEEDEVEKKPKKARAKKSVKNAAPEPVDDAGPLFAGISALPTEEAAAGDEVEAAVLACLKAAEEPLGKTEILARAGIAKGDWSRAIRALRESGRIVQEGQRRGARYRLSLGEEG